MECWANTKRNERCKNSATCGYFCTVHKDSKKLFWLEDLKRSWPARQKVDDVIRFMKLFESFVEYFELFDMKYKTTSIHKMLMESLIYAPTEEKEILSNYRLKYFHNDFYYYYTGALENYPDRGSCIGCETETTLLLRCCRSFLCRSCLTKWFMCRCGFRY